MNKKGLLVVSFGTSHHDTREKNIVPLETLLAEAFPDRTCYRAYTSKMILDILKKRDGLTLPTVPMAMEQLIQEGITDLLVQPTHIMNGLENEQMKEDIMLWKNQLDSLAFGAPLLTSTRDQEDLIQAVMEEFPPLKETEALMFMGHGSSHYANTVYAALDYAFKHQGHPHVYVGTVEAYPDLDTVMEDLKREHIRRVTLAPLMLVAGDHARNDLAGDGPDSWKSILESHGFETSCVLKGLGEYPGIRKLYIRHAKEALPL